MASALASTMYRVKPYFDSPAEIASSAAMYKVKNYASDLGGKLIAAGVEVQMSERVIQLQQRQKKVLTQLQKLQESVNLLAQERGISLTMTAPNAQSSLPQNVALKDLVISVNPSYVPLSLLVLLKQLSAQQNILTSAFVHSSATNMPEKLRTLFQNGTSTGPRNNYQLAITVIWKEIPSGPRLMISPTQQTYIEGEANIARYLSRLLKPAYDDTDFITATQIDEFLDVSQLQLLRGNSKERSAALRTLNARLGKGQWLVGSSCSVADVVAWSAIQTLKLVEDAPANIKKWLKACSESSPFEEAFMFLSS